MLILSTDVLPEGYTVETLYGLVEITQPIELSQKSLLRRVTEKESNGHEIALAELQKSALLASGGKANIIFGVKVSTAIGAFNNGTFLYMTYIGTAARVEQ